MTGLRGRNSPLAKGAKMGLTAADKVDFKIEEVDFDDYGDDEFKFHIIYYYKHKVVWDDYTRRRPSDTQCYNIILEVIKEGLVPALAPLREELICQ